MCKRKGEPLESIEFFNQLYSDEKFCQFLGKVMLSASRLESELINYLLNEGIREKTHRASLGALIQIAESHSLLGEMIPILREIKNQRNYLSHNLHALFIGLIEETVLPRADLLDSDMDMFTDKAVQLNENLSGIADIMRKYNEHT